MLDIDHALATIIINSLTESKLQAAMFTQTGADKVSFGTRRAACKWMFLLQIVLVTHAASLWHNEVVSVGTMMFFCLQELSQKTELQGGGFTWEGTMMTIRARPFFFFFCL